MKSSAIIVAIAALSVISGACSNQIQAKKPSVPFARPTIVVTYPVLGSLVRELADRKSVV